jgi:hemerythrin-like domain-containing protein
MLSIEKCNEILNKKEKKYTKEQVKAIRDYLYQFAEIIHHTKLSKDETGTTK